MKSASRNNILIPGKERMLGFDGVGGCGLVFQGDGERREEEGWLLEGTR